MNVVTSIQNPLESAPQVDIQASGEIARILDWDLDCVFAFGINLVKWCSNSDLVTGFLWDVVMNIEFFDRQDGVSLMPHYLSPEFTAQYAYLSNLGNGEQVQEALELLQSKGIDLTLSGALMLIAELCTEANYERVGEAVKGQVVATSSQIAQI